MSEQLEYAGKNDLCVCKKYMLSMMKVDSVDERFECMLFKYQFDNTLEGLLEDATKLIAACEEVKASARFRKLMMVILSFGNELNNSGSGEGAFGFTIETLLDLNNVRNCQSQLRVVSAVRIYLI